MPRRRATGVRTRQAEPVFTDTLELDLGTVVPSISGPKRPQDRVLLSEADIAFAEAMSKEFGKASDAADKPSPWKAKTTTLGHGDVFIAAITSCTNTSNPSVLIAAGLVARKAHEGPHPSSRG
jgi:aconitate hydratase